MHTLIRVTFSLPPGVRDWLRRLLEALPRLFLFTFMANDLYTPCYVCCALISSVCGQKAVLLGLYLPEGGQSAVVFGSINQVISWRNLYAPLVSSSCGISVETICIDFEHRTTKSERQENLNHFSYVEATDPKSGTSTLDVSVNSRKPEVNPMIYRWYKTFKIYNLPHFKFYFSFLTSKNV